MPTPGIPPQSDQPTLIPTQPVRGVKVPARRRAAVAAVGYLAFGQCARLIHSSGWILVLISTLLSLAILVLFTAELSGSFLKARSWALSALLAALVGIPFRAMLAVRFPPALYVYTHFAGVADLLLVWLAVSAGGLLSYLLRGANMVPPVAAALAVVDIWTVRLGGPVQQILQSRSGAALAVTRAMTVSLPTPRAIGAAPLPVTGRVGFADFLFIAFFIAGMNRLAPDPRSHRVTVITLIGVLCTYMLLVMHLEVGPLPALVPIAVVMIAVHWRRFHYQRSEVFALLYASLFMLIIAAAFWYVAHKAPHQIVVG